MVQEYDEVLVGETPLRGRQVSYWTPAPFTTDSAFSISVSD